MSLQKVCLDLQDDHASARTARSLVRSFASPWAYGDAVDSAALLTSELVTNAVRYGCPPLGLEVVRRHTTLRVAVGDAGTGWPAVSRQAVDAEGGRGLRLIENLSGSWGVDGREDGKTVWFELECGDLTRPLRPDDEVQVWNSYLRRWATGFEVHEVVPRLDLEYRLRRRSDGAVLPGVFSETVLRRAAD